jgi:hypothetical protein
MAELSPDEAARALELARAAEARSRRAVVEAPATGLLLYWGLAWLALYSGHALLRGTLGDVVTAVLLVLPVAWCAVRRWRGSAALVSGRERRLFAAWSVVVAASFIVPRIAQPATPATSGLLVGALWGLALLLYAVMAGDRALFGLGGGIILLAWFLAGHGSAAPLLFGLGAGGAMALVGGIRLWRGRQRDGRAG